MNTKSIVTGGLVAGLVMNAIDMVANVFILGDRYTALQERGAFLLDPRYPFMPIWVILLFLVGIALAWLYAVARPRLGAGPKTAVYVGLVVGLIAFVPPNFAQASWSAAGRFVPLVWMLNGIVDFVVGTLAAGAMYKE